MRALGIIAASLALVAAPALAQDDPAAPTPEQQQRASDYLRILIAGLQSEEVEQPIKNALVGCIYSNSLRAISETMDKAIEAAPEEFDGENPAHVLGMMASVCGYSPADASEADTSEAAVPGR